MPVAGTGDHDDRAQLALAAAHYPQGLRQTFGLAVSATGKASGLIGEQALRLRGNDGKLDDKA